MPQLENGSPRKDSRAWRFVTCSSILPMGPLSPSTFPALPLAVLRDASPPQTLTALPARSGCFVPALTAVLRPLLHWWTSPPAVLWRKHRGRRPGCPTSQELCSQSRYLRAQQVLLLRGASICPKSHHTARHSAPCCVRPAFQRPPRGSWFRAQRH